MRAMRDLRKEAGERWRSRRTGATAAHGRRDRRADRQRGHGAEAAGRRETAGRRAVRRFRMQPNPDPPHSRRARRARRGDAPANRGAFISSPDAEEAREVFEARRAIERSIVLSAAERIEAAGAGRSFAPTSSRRRGGGGARRPRPVDPALGRVSSPSGRGRRQFGAGEVSRGARRAHVADHRPLRLAQRALLLGSRTRGADRRARRARRRAGRQAMEDHLRHIERALDIRESRSGGWTSGASLNASGQDLRLDTR